ncbi:MAG TPA: hypothetical protein VI032_01115, partial [Burkholderiaceae bacterium]
MVAVADQLPPAGRLALLDALTHLPLTADAWADATPLLIGVLDGGFDAQAIDVLAGVPLLSVRQALRRRAWQGDDALGRQCALSLAARHDDACVGALMREFRRAPDVEVAQALACVLRPGLGVVAEDLITGLQSPDEEVRLWTAIAVARAGGAGTDEPVFGPLDQLWRATAAAPGAAPPSLFFEGPPAFLKGAPARAAALLAPARPLPDAVLWHVLALKAFDFDGWVPRDPSLVQDNGAVRALVAGLTGHFDADGDPLSAHPEDTGAQWATDPALAAALEHELESLAHIAAADPAAPSWLLGNRVLDIGRHFLPGGSLPIGKVLRNARIMQYLPRQALAWTLGRIGPEALIDTFARMLHSPQQFDRFESVQWLRDIAVELGTQAPYGGAGGREAALPQAELIDDLPHAAAVAPKSTSRGDGLEASDLDLVGAPDFAPAAAQPTPGGPEQGSADFSSGDPFGAPFGGASPDAAFGLSVPSASSPAEALAADPSSPPPQAGFHFILDGDAARGDAM